MIRMELVDLPHTQDCQDGEEACHCPEYGWRTEAGDTVVVERPWKYRERHVSCPSGAAHRALEQAARKARQRLGEFSLIMETFNDAQ